MFIIQHKYACNTQCRPSLSALLTFLTTHSHTHTHTHTLQPIDLHYPSHRRTDRQTDTHTCTVQDVHTSIKFSFFGAQYTVVVTHKAHPKYLHPLLHRQLSIRHCLTQNTPPATKLQRREREDRTLMLWQTSSDPLAAMDFFPPLM